MLFDLNLLLLVGSFLVLLSIVLARLSNNLGVPTLLLFMGVGMIAGEGGPGGIVFNDYALTQALGSIALVLILFSGGLDTHWKDVRPIVFPGTSLATVGVVVSTIVVGGAAHYLLELSWLEGLLLGAVVSSTDAAAVFAVLRTRNLRFKGPIAPLIEFESGTNDPMAVFLTVTLIEMIRVPELGVFYLISHCVIHMLVGLVFGWGGGRLSLYLLNHLRSQFDGLYPVVAMACAFLIFAATGVAGGSGFLAVYVAGLVLGNSDFLHRKNILRFFDGVAWLSQILMFILLGLLLTPRAMVAVAGSGLFVAFVLMLVARPLSVAVSLLPFGFNWRQILLVSWVGLRGAVPIVLATFPFLAGVPGATMIFNVVFFVVLISTVLQGWTVSNVAHAVGLALPVEERQRAIMDISDRERSPMKLTDLVVPNNALALGVPLVELHFPRDSLIILIKRGGDYVIPSGASVLEGGDYVQVLSREEEVETVRRILLNPKE
jgi:cell volume regulation protein A